MKNSIENTAAPTEQMLSLKISESPDPSERKINLEGSIAKLLKFMC